MTWTSNTPWQYYKFQKIELHNLIWDIVNYSHLKEKKKGRDKKGKKNYVQLANELWLQEHFYKTVGHALLCGTEYLAMKKQQEVKAHLSKMLLLRFNAE